MVLVIMANTNIDIFSISASRSGHSAHVTYFHAIGSNINADNDRALRCVVVYRNLELIKYRHINGANINSDDDYALRWAAKYGDLDIVKYLLENGACINYTNNILCFVNTDGFFTLKHGNDIIKLKPEIQTELCNFNNRIVRTKSAITKKN